MLFILFSYFDVVMGPKLLSFYPKNPRLKEEYYAALLTMFDVNFIEYPFNFKIENKCFLNYIIEISEPETRGRFDSYMISILIDDEDIFNEIRYIAIKYLQEFLDKYKIKYFLVRDVRKLLEANRIDLDSIDGGEEFFKDLQELYQNIHNQMKAIREEEIISDRYFNVVANVFEINPLPIVVLNSMDEIIFGNIACGHLFECDMEEMKGNSILNYIPEIYHDSLKASFKKIFTEHSISNIKGEINTRSGKRQSVSMNLNYLGGGLGVSLIFKKVIKFPYNVLKSN